MSRMGAGMLCVIAVMAGLTASTAGLRASMMMIFKISRIKSRVVDEKVGQNSIKGLVKECERR